MAVGILRLRIRPLVADEYCAQDDKEEKSADENFAQDDKKEGRERNRGPLKCLLGKILLFAVLLFTGGNIAAPKDIASPQHVATP